MSFAVSYANNKGFKDQPNEMACLQDRIKDIAQVLRTQVSHNLAEDGSWREFWAVDPTATELTEAGSIPKSPEEFLQATRRDKRWCCGITLQCAAGLKNLNILVWELKKAIGAGQDLFMQTKNQMPPSSRRPMVSCGAVVVTNSVDFLPEVVFSTPRSAKTGRLEWEQSVRQYGFKGCVEGC